MFTSVTKPMNPFASRNRRLAAVLCGVVLLGFSRSARADLALFKFTGTGINGSIAWGSFTVADTALVPNYSASGGIYPSISMTISNIPGAGPGFVFFNKDEIYGSWFNVDSNGVPSILPLGSHDFGPPGYNHYDLGGGPESGQGALAYNGSSRDIIIWSSLTRVYPPVPPALSSQATASDLTLLWPVSADTFIVEGTSDLAAPAWSAVTNSATIIDDTVSVTLPLDGIADHFFRLRWTGP